MRNEHALALLVILFTGLISGCISARQPGAAAPAPEVKFEGRYIDVHTHIMPGKMPLEEIIRNMDAAGIDTMVIMESPTEIYLGLPQADYGIPDAAQEHPGRFIALYGGEAITMLYSAAANGSYTKAEEERYSRLLEEAMRSGRYGGFGEIALRHFSDTETEPNITVPGDHPWMLLMSDIAAKYNVPIDIHMEATDETVAGMEKLLDHNKTTKIIWEHAGRSNTGRTTPQLMRRLMEKHPNLYSAIKIRDPGTLERIAVRILDDEDMVVPEWMALFRDFPDRFMIGSDIKPGEKDNEFKHIKNHRKLLRQLPPEILKKMERENAKRIYNIP